MNKLFKNQLIIGISVAVIALVLFCAVIVNVNNLTTSTQDNSAQTEEISNLDSASDSAVAGVFAQDVNKISETAGETVSEETSSEPVIEVVVPETNTETSSTESKKSKSSASKNTKNQKQKTEVKVQDQQQKKEQPHVHSYGDWYTVNDATCTTDGQKERRCSCGQKETESIKATGHTFGEWRETSKPTVTSKGQRSRTCSKCGKSEHEEIPMLESYQVTVKLIDANTNEEVPISIASYTLGAEHYSGNRMAAGAPYAVSIYTLSGDEYKLPTETKTGTVNGDTVVTFYLYPKYTYSETTASVGTVMNGGFYYNVNGKYNLCGRFPPVYRNWRSPRQFRW